MPTANAIIQVHLAIDADAEKPRRLCVIHYRDGEGRERLRTYDHIPPQSWSQLCCLTKPGDRLRIISAEWYRSLLRIVERLGGWYFDSEPEVHV